MVTGGGRIGLAREQWRVLGQTLALAVFHADGTLDDANDRYLALLGRVRVRAPAPRPHHRELCAPGFAGEPDLAAFWSTLQAGGIRSGPFEYLRPDGGRCWLEATYVPVLGEAGQLLQVLQVAKDVTERLLQQRAVQARLHLLSLVADASDTAVVISDATARIEYVNAGFTRMLGWPLEEVVGRAPIALLVPHQTQAAADAYRAALRAGQAREREEIVVGKSGQRYWAKVISNPVFGATGELERVVTVLADITRAKLHEVLQHPVLEAMARDRPVGEVLALVCCEVERIAPEVTVSIVGVDEQGLLHPLAASSLSAEFTRLLDGLPIGPAAGSCGTAAWRNAPVQVDDIAHDPLWADYLQLVSPLGFCGCWSTPICNSQGKVVGTFAFYYRAPRGEAVAAFHQQLVDACTHLCALALEREHTRLRIHQLAFYDELTGLPNRSLLLAQADQAIAAAARNHAALAVLFIDLDRFKQVNDSLGHPAGDALLRGVADRLRQSLRASDIAGRLSGDEFVVVLPQCEAERAAGTVERLQAQLAEPMTIAGAALAVTASVGIAMFPADGRAMQTLLQCADMAMYQAKSTGRGHFSFFSDEMNQQAQERLALETALRAALRADRLCLHYQPQVDMVDGRLCGVEALARWTDATLGEVPPLCFIPLAEECGLVADLGRWALREACRQLAAWRAQGWAVPAVSVNLSPTVLHDLALPDLVAEVLRSHGLAPRDLTLELTESAVLDSHPSTRKTIAAVHAQGVRLSMDDFGTGYASLSSLRSLPVSEIKLDRGFVADLEHSASARALSSAILGIGRSLGLAVVAEGVETVAQQTLLCGQGYALAQGYLFAQALAPAELERWMAATPLAVRAPLP